MVGKMLVLLKVRAAVHFLPEMLLERRASYIHKSNMPAKLCTSYSTLFTSQLDEDKGRKVKFSTVIANILPARAISCLYSGNS